jgi:integrase/recombinase XerC
MDFDPFRTFLSERGAKDRTVQAYIADLTLALADIGDFERSNIERYLSYLVGRGTARSTVARKLASLRAYGDYLLTTGDFLLNPALRVSAPHRSRHVASEQYLTRRDQVLLEVAQASGLSPQQLTDINAEDVDWRAAQVRIYDAAGEMRLISLGQVVRPLRDYLSGRSRGPLFLSASGDRLTAAFASSLLGLDDDEAETTFGTTAVSAS